MLYLKDEIGWELSRLKSNKKYQLLD